MFRLFVLCRVVTVFSIQTGSKFRIFILSVVSSFILLNLNQAANAKDTSDTKSEPFGVIKSSLIARPNIASTKERALTRDVSDDALTRFAASLNCDFESNCNWKWNSESFFVASWNETNNSTAAPKEDAAKNGYGHYLLLHLNHLATEYHLRSPMLPPTRSTCRLHVTVYEERMNNTEIRVVGDRITESTNAIRNHTQWFVDKIQGSNNKRWSKLEFPIGKISDNFTLLIEVVPSPMHTRGAVIAFDNIYLSDCYAENAEFCATSHYRCQATHNCINISSICDITKDCINGDDEALNCELMPYGSRCSFEEDWCGWYNVDGKVLEWVRHNGSTPTNFTGPDHDHTYMNKTGKYLYVNMLKDEAGFASTATLRSALFNPPPRIHGNVTSKYYNSCKIRFYLHQTGKHKSGILLQVTELRSKDNYSTDIYWSYEDYGDRWVRQVRVLPNITHKYFLHFDVKRGYRYISDIAIDDVSLTPECFGLNIPVDELNGYNYWNPEEDPSSTRETHPDFINETVYEITTCGAKGRVGPTSADCARLYLEQQMKVLVVEESRFSGVQQWVVPEDGYYTLILSGASGGKGSSATGSSRGATVRIVVLLNKGESLYFLVGQEGASACIRSLGHLENSSCYSDDNTAISNGIRAVLHMEINDGGGGGGGATYVFSRDTTSNNIIPIAVAGGGGGIGLGRFLDDEDLHGKHINVSVPPIPGKSYGEKYSGAGGGWNSIDDIYFLKINMTGSSLLDGGVGGRACYNSTDGRGDGGFGGGGGGCKYGGGGGGYAGGDGAQFNHTNGKGGYSFADPRRTIAALTEGYPGFNAGPGYVLIIPAVSGCSCDYQCVALDQKRAAVTCICPKEWRLDEDGKTCKGYVYSDVPETSYYPPWFVVLLIVAIMLITSALAFLCFTLYNKYQQKTSGILERKMFSNADLQLDRLRFTSDAMMTEYNPNYEFGGAVYTLKDLKDIPREQLRLVKALGQGAFGEVYQGFYRQRPCDTVEMPVAVKTLPEMSTSQAEMDFLMEALIMSKFNHPNIVHFIGVCFDKHPRFIVLELLAGGDLKNFLRETRPRPDRSSTLTMKDLVLIAADVAKGCKYLEDNRFIHRDIAARNCLLTTKGPGRVVKIADFGMSRDVYRSDYYRKGGKAMLPIKWMPPEAFLDGIFTCKTDVWSFGVLLWEIMSMGYMPYTGCANREVMQLVTSGGRLDPPTNCPCPIYGIMTQCWHPNPEHRPTFSTILERLGYCLQDQQVIESPLPVFHRMPSAEREGTLIRPSKSDNTCLQISQPSDYLIPNSVTMAESTSSVEKLLPDKSIGWDRPLSMHLSKSTQPLLLDEMNKDNTESSSVDALIPLNTETSRDSLRSNDIMKTNGKRSDLVLKSGLSLDPSVLAKQIMTPQKYAVFNNDSSSHPPSTNYTSTSNTNNFLTNSEINC